MSLADYGLKDDALKKAIHIDTEAGYMFGDDHAYNDYPIRFPTVEFQLVATLELSLIADAMRKTNGLLPMLEDGGATEGWYDFYLGLNSDTDTRLHTSILFVVVNSDSADNENHYAIDLSEEEQKRIFAIMDDLCWRYYEKSCDELLDKARRAMGADG